MAEAGWTKLGLRVQATGAGHLVSHAMLPTPLLLSDRIRVFFSACDADLRGRVFYADLDRDFPFATRELNPRPVLDLGAPGCFDCDGVNPSCLVRLADISLRLYYIGWRRLSQETPYTLIAGIATSIDDGLNFRRAEEPVLPPTPDEPLFRTAPFVWREGRGWRMLYIGGGRFFDGPEGKRLPLYSLCEARSGDGLAWDALPSPLLEPDRARGEIGFGRPVLMRQVAGGLQLLISRRTIQGYRQMRADWPLRHNGPELRILLEPGPETWDNEMTCFGAPLEVDDRQLLFYNGNAFGRTGFGLAWRWLA